MKTALAQINTTAGDLRSNARKARAWIRRAHDVDADLVIFPEMTLAGYAPRGLVREGDFDRRCREALEELAEEAGDVCAVVGHVAQSPGGVRNAVSLLAGGEVAATRYKSRLEASSDWAEGDYFVPGELPLPQQADGRSIVPLFADELNACLEQKPEPPQAEMAAVLASRPFVRERGEPVELLERLAAQWDMPVAYVNLVGGNDGRVFPGYSRAVSPQGTTICRAAGFQEDMATFRSGSDEAAPELSASREPVGELFEALRLGLADYARKCGFEHAVLGLSGGIDSSVVAAIAAAAFGGENVTALLMPSTYSSRASTDHARAVAENLGINYRTVSIERIRDAFRDTLDPLFMDTEEGVTEENIQARIRGMLVMAMSNKFGYMPLATGNRSELAVGYCTLYGDTAGALAVLGDVSKGDVYDLANYINRRREIIPQKVLDKPPSAELKPDQRDTDDLPPYEQLDTMLDLYLDRHQGPAEMEEAGIPSETFYAMRQRIQRSEFKRRQTPPAIRVSAAEEPEFPMASGDEPDYGLEPEPEDEADEAGEGDR
ncbi:MAG: NAD+ synthase [Planctomycetota bacterium]